MSIYDTTGVDGFNLFSKVGTYAPYGEGALIIVFFVAFLMFRGRWGTLGSLAPATFITSFFAVGFFIYGILNEAWVYAGILGIGLSIMLIFLKNE